MSSCSSINKRLSSFRSDSICTPVPSLHPRMTASTRKAAPARNCRTLSARTSRATISRVRAAAPSSIADSSSSLSMHYTRSAAQLVPSSRKSTDKLDHVPQHQPPNGAFRFGLRRSRPSTAPSSRQAPSHVGAIRRWGEAVPEPSSRVASARSLRRSKTEQPGSLRHRSGRSVLRMRGTVVVCTPGPVSPFIALVKRATALRIRARALIVTPNACGNGSSSR